MKKKNLRRATFLFGASFCLSLIVGANVMAQETKPTPAASPTPAQSPAPQQTPPLTNLSPGLQPANPADVSSMDAIIKAVYDVISGDAGVKRDWNRFRSLFHPKAQMIPTQKTKDGRIAGIAITPEDYITRSGPFLEKEGFHEREVARRVEQFGNIAHVFSTYDAKHKMSDEKPFMRGINSIQLLNDGKRWWVLTIAWSQETPDSPIPEKYLKSVQ
jgi:hypothetical protein